MDGAKSDIFRSEALQQPRRKTLSEPIESLFTVTGTPLMWGGIIALSAILCATLLYLASILGSI